MASESSGACIQCDPYDIEEELESFFIRKASSKRENSTDRTTLSKEKTIPNSIKVFDHIPMLICDILKLDQKQLEKKQMVLHLNSVPFKSCLLFARIIGRSRDTDNYYKYLIDDGTGTMEMSVLRQRRHYEELLRLENEIKGYEVVAAAQNKKEISSCLLRMLAFTKEQINYSSIFTGNKILAYGKPSVYRGQIGFIAYSLLNNEKLCSFLEIEFKDFIIEQNIILNQI